MTLDERQREITIKSKKGTSAGFQVSELLQANTVTMQYIEVQIQIQYNFQNENKGKAMYKKHNQKRVRRALDSEYLNKSRQIPTESNYQDKEEIHKNVKVDP